MKKTTNLRLDFSQCAVRSIVVALRKRNKMNIISEIE